MYFCKAATTTNTTIGTRDWETFVRLKRLRTVEIGLQNVPGNLVALTTSYVRMKSIRPYSPTLLDMSLYCSGSGTAGVSTFLLSKKALVKFM